MKLKANTLFIIIALVFGTTINAKDDKRCVEAYGDVYGEKDSYGQSYEDFIKEQKNEKKSLEFLLKHCKNSKYKAETESLQSVTKFLKKTTKISKANWEKEFKYP